MMPDCWMCGRGPKLQARASNGAFNQKPSELAPIPEQKMDRPKVINLGGHEGKLRTGACTNQNSTIGCLRTGACTNH